MVFHSPNFLCFFAVLVLCYSLFKKLRLLILAAGNLLFYAASGIGMLAIFLIVTLITYACVQGMRRSGMSWLFWVGISIHVANLVFFKYTLFLVDTVEGILGLELAWAGVIERNIVLPVGISFYTFQFLSYFIDVRKGRIEPTPSLLRFWVYISFFPQLIAGPIMRGNELMPQLEELEKKKVRWSEMKYGLALFITGLLKKIVFADQLAQLVDPLFVQGADLNGAESWIAAYLFGFQIYFDFSAYSDMALGLAGILGIRLVLNFDTPYLSANPSEFWKRWHITLSRWIRDYIYIGLGGNRRGPIRVQFNLLAAMLISGLWHGAMWTFVLWGAVHGLLQIVYRWTLKLNRWMWVKRVREMKLYRIVAVFCFFHVITWTWVFFRAQSFGQALDMTREMLHVDMMQLLHQPMLPWIGGLFLLHMLEYSVRHREVKAAKLWHLVPFPVRSAVYLGILLVLFYFAKGETYEFIYFQF